MYLSGGMVNSWPNPYLYPVAKFRFKNQNSLPSDSSYRNRTGQLLKDSICKIPLS
jgi:hypothetical protein